MERKTKQTSKAKIDKMVAEGARNYPAYLKLIYTGESELSSEDEFFTPNIRDDIHRHSPNSCHATLTSCIVSAPGKSEAISPGLESAKLRDEGKEKIATPNDGETSMNTDSPIVEEKQVMEETPKQEKEKELLQIQEEIASLKSLLETKVTLANQLKRKLGLTPMSELKMSIINIKQSETFMKTNAALRSLGNLASKTIGNWRITASLAGRNSQRENHVKQSKSLSNVYEQSQMAMYSSSTSLKLTNTD